MIELGNSAIQQSIITKMEAHKVAASSRKVLQNEHKASGVSLEFGHLMKGAIDTVHGREQVAKGKVTAVELGLSDDLIGATVAQQKAQLSFNALMEVRNKFVSNLDEILKMPL
ncbi:flagellar hook-basal body complex protein FliE [Vibrio breoganii]